MAYAPHYAFEQKRKRVKNEEDCPDDQAPEELVVQLGSVQRGCSENRGQFIS